MTFDLKTGIIKKLKGAPKQKRREEMQVSPSGMAAASQAVPGEFDSRHLLQKSTSRSMWLVDFTYYLFTLHFSLVSFLSIFEVISNSE